MSSFEIFSFQTLQNIDATLATNYITKCFFPLTNGDHAYFVEDELTGKPVIRIMDDATIKKVYFKRFSDSICNFYFKEFKCLRKIVCVLNKPVLYDDKINICPPIKAQYKPYDEFSKKTQDAVKLFLRYILEVLASDNQDSYEYILNWIANMLKGNKNDACIYLKGGQGIGKSTISDFLKEHVIGRDLFLETGSSPLKKNFNKILEGKLLVQFSELETMSKNEWACCSSALKRNITSTTILIEGKNENSYQIANINNYILDSNNDAIKDDEGRRYFIADVSPKYQNDRTYFGKIRKECFHDEVGDAFFSLMLERNTDGFIAQNYPLTNNKLHSLTKRLDSAYTFLKFKYVLPKNDLKLKPKELYDDYTMYCQINRVQRMHNKSDFMIKLADVGINYKKTNGNNFYRFSHEELKAISDKQKWVHELDYEEIDVNEVCDDENTDAKCDDKDDEINQLKNEVERLKKLLEEATKQNKVTDDETIEDEIEFRGHCLIHLENDDENDIFVESDDEDDIFVESEDEDIDYENYDEDLMDLL